MIIKRLASTSTAASGSATSPRKIVLVGAGFLGSYIARALVADPRNRVVLVSRNPQPLYDQLRPLGNQILPPARADITSADTSDLSSALEGASAVVSLVGVLVGNAKKMEAIQLHGAERVARVAKEQGVDRVVLMSAIGADKLGETPYWRTKGLAEEAFLKHNPTTTIIRPSIVFGPGDSFFNAIYAGDVARAVEVCCRSDPEVVKQVGGKIIEAGGPDVFTYREIMQLVLRYSGRQGRRLILSLPYWVGKLQGLLLERLPENLFTVTRDQVQQLKHDNIVSPVPPLDSLSFSALLSTFPSSLPTSAPLTPNDPGLSSVHKILPTYLGPVVPRAENKRTHGRIGAGFDEVQQLKMKQGQKKP